MYLLYSLIWKKTKKFYRKEKKISMWKSARNRYSVMQIMTRENNHSTNALRLRRFK